MRRNLMKRTGNGPRGMKAGKRSSVRLAPHGGRSAQIDTCDGCTRDEPTQPIATLAQALVRKPRVLRSRRSFARIRYGARASEIIP